MNTAQQLQISGQDYENREKIKLAGAIDVLKEALKEDKGYYESWKANIAMAVYDEFENIANTYNSVGKQTLHNIANKAAENFLHLLMS